MHSKVTNLQMVLEGLYFKTSPVFSLNLYVCSIESIYWQIITAEKKKYIQTSEKHLTVASLSMLLPKSK